MKRPILEFMAFVCLAVIWQAVHQMFGQAEGFRMWGIGLLVVSVALTFRASIPVHFGRRQVGELVGWRRAYVLLPAYIIGGLVTLFPHQVACTISLKGYVCP